MLRIYRFAGGLLGLFAVWVAALRSDLQPTQHKAVLLVSSRCHDLLCCTPDRVPSWTACFPLSLLICFATAGPCFSCGFTWSVLRDFPDFWCDHLPYCSGRGNGFAAGRAHNLMCSLDHVILLWC